MVLDGATRAAVATSKVLVVGAGGIGCELLKNLVLTSFVDISVVDLDTIDISNLNRQFLFRKCHVGMSKAEVARESVLKFNPSANITAYHGNIKDERFGAAFFEQFDLVLNALDNVAARRHVNRLCLALGIPLVESGTQGYKGQTTVIRKGHTACFECEKMEAPKTFAVCTIRNTPDQPVHCVVWAKYVLAMLFGPADQGDNIMMDKADEGDGLVHASLLAGPVDDVPGRIFTQFFKVDIEKSLQVKDRWATRAPPVPLDLDDLLQSEMPTEVAGAARDQTALTPAENARVLVDCLAKIMTERSDAIGSIEFDKDDDLLMDCVSALANLRMHVFGIPTCSRFEVKGIAGNIVHAIATTNAIAAGLIVIEAIKVVTKQFDKCRTVWIKREGPKILVPQMLDRPRPSCFVCSKSKLVVSVDTTTFRLRDFFAGVLRAHLGMNTPSIDVFNRDNYVGSEDDHEDNQAYLDRVLSDPGVRIGDGAILSVDDLSQKFQVDLLVRHRATGDDNESSGGPAFEVVGDLDPTPRDVIGGDDDAAAASLSGKKRPRPPADDGDDVVVIVD
ncbi:unnamed protein product (mitochondrion) [Plasmodiophora brassicae]|uniref:SUMO-activating enzyme subunit n=1 Tax=Plasmodiophora brassicae TaxID=37360 RepID=A0A3P3YL23_PLABS|nr:unnamed protein product [Plasmodiophora brassicae]